LSGGSKANWEPLAGAMFCVSAFVKSQAATLTVMMPFRIALGLPATPIQKPSVLHLGDLNESQNALASSTASDARVPAAWPERGHISSRHGEDLQLTGRQIPENS